MAAVINDGDGSLGAYLLARVHHTAAASLGDQHTGGGTLVAGCLHHLHRVGIRLVATHGHVDALLHDSALLVDATVKLRLGTRTDDLGYVEVGIVETALVSTADNLLEDFVLNPLYVGIEKFLLHN